MIHPAVGTDFGVGRIVVHSVLRGAGVPLGEHSCKTRIGLRDTVQHSLRDTFWKAALRSRATRTRELSASARYWMVLIVFAPSGLPTPYCKGPAHLATDSFFAAITDLSASRRRKDIIRSALWPPVGLASGVICPAFKYCSTGLGTAAAAMCAITWGKVETHMTLMSNIAVKYVISSYARVLLYLRSNLCCACSLRMMLSEEISLASRLSHD